MSQRLKRVRSDSLWLKRSSASVLCSLRSWAELEDLLQTKESPPSPSVTRAFRLQKPPEINRKKGKLIFFRDVHGWCPYSERVWLALELKGVPFECVLVDNLGYRPDWWYDVNPSGQTPAMTFLDGKTQSDSIPLLRQIDAEFPDSGPSLVPTDAQEAENAKRAVEGFREWMPRGARPSSRGAFLFQGGGAVPRDEFERTFDRLESFLQSVQEGKKQKGKESNAPMFMAGGAAPTLADCVWVPFLERFAVQVPLLHPAEAGGKEALCPRSDRWPLLCAWYDAMESLPVYAARVRGDRQSWTRVLGAAVGGGLEARVRKTVQASEREMEEEEAEAEAEDLMSSDAEVWSVYRSEVLKGRGESLPVSPSHDVAARMIVNREAMRRDFGGWKRSEGRETGKKGGRSEEEKDALVDAGLRMCVEAMIDAAGDNELVRLVAEESDPGVRDEAVMLCEYFPQRLCVPRDMGALSGKALRYRLKLLRRVLNKNLPSQ
uniref:GST N-terminal domain-containing protein n=1 Tax=Chromera velia CCMP2878 TaxID=1169474 RepID=A0A0G4HTW9_9ALVE|eukprot:Cvel_8553.t1-p1 / transcript=Cvel_8553.t1 / gene=Cvel_8553 / organism=Chromera_velia_CCMP2878 / gene_product=Glutathione S-transferase L1, putative / transcript_product=Glutathione S-transferase L1, putative / location=Cvel_scaffold474:64709-66175(+) / protein_length=489 / sequence_SO=supercontig / SO=protein_coding / is_pseudo=false